MYGNRKKRKFAVTDLHLCTMVFYVKVVLGCLEFSVQSQRYVCSDMYAPICLYLLLSRGNQTPVDITSLSELKNPTCTIEVFPKHGASFHNLGTIGKPLISSRGALSWFHNVFTYSGEDMEY